MIYVCMVCGEIFESDKTPGKIEEEWSNPVLCPVCKSDEIREASPKEESIRVTGVCTICWENTTKDSKYGDVCDKCLPLTEKK